MLPPILMSIKEQLVAKEGERSQSENDFLNELCLVEKLLQNPNSIPRVIKPIKRETIIADSRQYGV